MENEYQFLTDVQVEDRPDPDWLIANILPASSLGLVVGQSESFKTFLVLDWVLSIGTGSDWLGHKCEEGLVAYIAAEGTPGLGRRIKAWKSFNDHRVTKARFLLEVVPFMHEQAQNDLLRTLEDLPEAPKMVVVDTMHRSMAGGDENSAKDVGTFVDVCDRIRKITGATVLTVHHMGKSKVKKERGSSALRGAMDTVFLVERSGKSSSMTVTCDKQKDAEGFDQIGLKKEVIKVGSGTSCILIDREASAALTEKEKEVLDVLKGTATRAEWMEKLGLAPRTFDRVAKSLVAKGYVGKTEIGSYVITEKGQNAAG